MPVLFTTFPFCQKYTNYLHIFTSFFTHYIYTTQTVVFPFFCHKYIHIYYKIYAYIFYLTRFVCILYNFFEIMRKMSRKNSLRKYISSNISNIVVIYFFSLLFLSNNVFLLAKDFLPNFQAQILADILFFARHIFSLCVFPSVLFVFCYFAQTSLILHFLFLFVLAVLLLFANKNTIAKKYKKTKLLSLYKNIICEKNIFLLKSALLC